MPKVSVIVPVYNVEQYLAECLNSIISQTLQDIEIICVDDGSTDNSGKILDDYAVREGRIRVIHQENCGVSKSRNKAIRSALGEFVMFVDSDDLLPDILILEKYKKKELLQIILNLLNLDFQILDHQRIRLMSYLIHYNIF